MMMANGRFMIAKSIGKGSFGEIFQGLDTQTMKEVAIKMVSYVMPIYPLGNNYSQRLSFRDSPNASLNIKYDLYEPLQHTQYIQLIIDNRTQKSKEYLNLSKFNDD
jgi:serine/threonine protein kinase